jgi:O-antigen ligase
MIQPYKIQDSIENKITFFHLAAFLTMLPFDRFYSQIVLVSLIIHALIHCRRSNLANIFNFRTVALASVFIVNLIGIIYSTDRQQALKDLEVQLAILLVPIIFSMVALDFKRYGIRLLTFFSIVCVFAIIYLYGDAIHIIVYNHLPLNSLLTPAFINHNFSAPIGMHATYFSMYVTLSISVMLYLFLTTVDRRSRIVIFISLGILMLGLLQLASRSVLIATIIIIAIGFPLFLPGLARKIKYILPMLLMVLLAVFAITRIDVFKKRYIAEFKQDLSMNSFKNDFLEPRIARWRCAIKLIGQAPLVGHGSGSETRLLKDAYFDNKLYISYLESLNTHNQYLSLLLKNGVWGLLLFLLTLVWGFALAWYNKDVLFLAFLVLISVVCFSENVLNVNKGIFFYAFFFAFFVYSGKPLRRLTRLVKESS